ncbi:hypothetical protein A2348_02725 [Candidatus Uhrbacteria bacterium RIFOXYB12_FULL_58_10]|uniref:Cold-shock protein n=1 Tax=Candidatus Uhrbacteria bacterium RIFOXYB2_FULL_57_15 TaxID=1802422 RepID=A0A1F7W6X2_9BACT|nr:MAG: hypothetical protein A2348_02725 [Candidatus Uhrbacteria bacterium RIFOXYB12_FULL_58_10]OGL98519.1 MAG: hypothetical protein A2304_02165 [Candidatus Uhrbacteria bacterium RIFOXYB2_FULL_57_15]
MIAAGFFAASPYLDFPWYLIAFVSVNLATFLLFCLDKRLAALESRRIPERTLHLTAFLFGSPGAIVAMHIFRHKTRKTSFQLVLALLVLIQVAAVVGFLCVQEPGFFFGG